MALLIHCCPLGDSSKSFTARSEGHRRFGGASSCTLSPGCPFFDRRAHGT